MSGGTGNDTYVVRGGNDVVVENANEGIDHVQSFDSYVLTANVENLELIAGDIDGTGNGLDNDIYGTDGVNVLSGLGGNDDFTAMPGMTSWSAAQATTITMVALVPTS